MEHLIDLLVGIAWPVAILVMFFTLRTPITEMVSFARNFKYKDFEVTFRDRIGDLTTESENYLEVERLPPEEIEDAYRLVEISHSAAIMESWKAVEIAAREKVQELVNGEVTLHQALQRPLIHLEHSGALTPATIRTVRELRELRNQFAHTKGVELSKEDVFDYVRLAKELREQQIRALQELPKLKHQVLTLLILELNHLIDTGKYTHISIDDVHKHIESKDVIEYLRHETAGDSDFSIFRADGPYARYMEHYNDELLSIYGGYAGDERRKWGVENMGLCLLIAWTNEMIQQGSGWYPRD